MLMPKNIIQRYHEFVLQNRHLSPVFSQIAIPEKQNSFQYVGGQIFNGTLYSVINSAQKMMSYRLKDQSFHFSSSFSDEDFKWTGGYFYSGIFYMFPRRSCDLLAYDPANDRFETISCKRDYSGEHHYGGVCTRNGMIYQPPRNTNHILKWDISRKHCEAITINNGNNCRYCGSVIHPNGSIYMIPEKDAPVIKIDLETEQICEIGEAVRGMAFNPVIAANGNIYGFRAKNGILKIDTENDSVSILHSDISIRAYGSKCGINGNIYSLPGYTKDIWEFDPFEESLRRCYELSEERSVHYAGGATDRTGDIYGIPVHADSILKISFTDLDMQIPEDIFTSFFTDCY